MVGNCILRGGKCRFEPALMEREHVLIYAALAWWIVAGMIAFHGLRTAVTRSAKTEGHLELLGLSTLKVPAATVRSVRRYAFAIRLIAVISLCLLVGFSAHVFSTGAFAGDANNRTISVLVVLVCAASALSLRIVVRWIRTLWLAVALTDVRMVSVVNTAEKALARTSPLEDEEWRNTVELPTLRLAREALPLLSTGWGVSLFAVGSSFAGLAVASFLLVLELNFANGAAALVPASLAAFAVWLFCKVVMLSRFVALSSR